jgi:5S rRNA maturation endonuclease (ribonuclease M5)
LFGEAITPSVLERIEPLKAKYKAVLFVEGSTDAEYMRIAAKAANREELLKGIEIRFDEGARKAALQALLFRQLVGASVPASVLLDWDEMGREAQKLLKKYNWEKKNLKTYRDWLDSKEGQAPVEAEDMFSQRLLGAFEGEYGDSVLQEKARYQDGSFHYGFNKIGKDTFVAYAKQNARASDVRTWVTILEDCRKNLGL